MKVKINGKYYFLSIDELEFVRSLIGEWEDIPKIFKKPLYIPIVEIAKAKGITKQAVHDYANRHEIKKYKIGSTSFVTFDDCLQYWFRSIK